MNFLDDGGRVAGVLLTTLALRATGPFEGPGEANGFAVHLGLLSGGCLQELGDSLESATAEALNEGLIRPRVECGSPSHTSVGGSRGCRSLGRSIDLRGTGLDHEVPGSREHTEARDTVSEDTIDDTLERGDGDTPISGGNLLHPGEVVLLGFAEDSADQVHPGDRVLGVCGLDGLECGANLDDEVTNGQGDVMVVTVEHVDVDQPGIAFLGTLTTQPWEADIRGEEGGGIRERYSTRARGGNTGLLEGTANGQLLGVSVADHGERGVALYQRQGQGGKADIGGTLLRLGQW